MAANITHCSAVAATKVANYNLQCHAAAYEEGGVGQLLLLINAKQIEFVQKILRCPETDGLIQDLKKPTPSSSKTEAKRAQEGQPEICAQ